MVQGLAFLSKKSWHVKNIANQEKVWVAEQREEQEKAKAQELAKQIQQEREQEELDKIAGKSSGSRMDRGIDWMYHGHEKESEIAKQDAAKKSEEYLLGKEFVPDTVKGDLAAAAEETQGMNAVVTTASTQQSTDNLEDGESKPPAWSEPSVAERNEAFRMRHEDPMFAVTHQQVQKKQEFEKKKELFERVTGKTAITISKEERAKLDEDRRERKRKHKKRHKKEHKRHKKDHKSRKRDRRERRRHSSDEEDDYSRGSYDESFNSYEEYRRHRSRSPERHRRSDRHHQRERSRSREKYNSDEGSKGYDYRPYRHHPSQEDSRSGRSYGDLPRDSFGRAIPPGRDMDRHHHYEDRRRYTNDERTHRDSWHRSGSFSPDRHRTRSRSPPRRYRREEGPARRRNYSPHRSPNSSIHPDESNRGRHSQPRRDDAVANRKAPPEERMRQREKERRQEDRPSVDQKTPPPPEAPAHSVTKQKGYGLQGASNVSKPLRAEDLGPDRELLRKKREAKEAEKKQHRERAMKRAMTTEERENALRAMQEDAESRFHESRSRPRQSDEPAEEPKDGQAAFLNDMSRQVHGVSEGSMSLQERVSQNRMSNQRRHEGFL